MNNKLLLAFFFFICNQFVQAQHCEYDNAQLIGMLPHAENSNQIIEGLKITWIDKDGNPVLLNKTPYQDDPKAYSIEKSSLIAWRNPHLYLSFLNEKRNLQKRYFPFASNHYILISSFYGQDIFVKIEDIDKEHNGGHFETKIVTVPAAYILKLCGYRHPSLKHETTYKAINIELKRLDKDKKNAVEKQFGDYNFDGFEDYRILTQVYYASYDYFIYNTTTNTYIKDTFLSTMSNTIFDWTHKNFRGGQLIILNKLSRQADHYDFYEGKLTVVHRSICTQVHENSERSDCTIYRLKKGKLEFAEYLQGAE
ncbi:hypothetical protein H2O64_18980 [Kordia sp. YSTF-M3]|uniref:Uncharacterized protein n=1 Tax=Kordia aestuariivivens TaxID=2759037 RepID=A0ABR7QDX4_9FLAO|nr:hypothetical protein [Kordia aestuariivivens]MBC8756766.1 hypothetical protein [Kordia aestuariivivens]